MLARQFAAMGHEVTVVTATPGSSDGAPADEPYRIVRTQRWADLVRWTAWAQRCLVFGPTLRLLLIPLLLGRRTLVTHAAEFPWQSRPLVARLQWLASWLCAKRLPVHGPSQSICARLPRPHVHIPNPYDASTFAPSALHREGDLLYVGRLSEEKGVDTLLHALGILREQGLRPRLSIIGLGSEQAALQALAQQLKVQEAIDWRGLKNSSEVAQAMNQHRVLVVPSRCKEAFGIVVLEGLASGCQVVVSRKGGLVEAGGGWARDFQNGDAQELATQITAALKSDSEAEAAAIADYLSAHTPAAVARSYLQHMGAV